MDGIGEALKNWVYRDVMSGKNVTDIPKPFAERADKAIKGITSLYVPAEDVLMEPDNINASLRIKDTLQIHMTKQFFDDQNVPYSQFFKMAAGEKAIFIQFHGEGASGH